MRARGEGTVDNTKGGYVYVTIAGRRYRKHRLVMEEQLGRPLTSGENVHHINGVRTDNDPANLELWIVSQPPGQRVADVINWAIEILRRYSPNTLQIA